MYMRTSNELQIGKAGEYIVCADLIMKGFVAFPSEQGLPYDVLLDVGHRLFRVQVKTTACPRIVPQRAKESKAYIFNVKRAGKNNTKRYLDTEIDLFALVCLDTRKVGYLKTNDMPDTINIRPDELKGTHYDELGIQNYRMALSLKETHNHLEIAKKIGIHVSQVYRMLQEGYKPYETSARYFSDFERTREWFSGI
jgi:hypothetical protein